MTSANGTLAAARLYWWMPHNLWHERAAMCVCLSLGIPWVW